MVVFMSSMLDIKHNHERRGKEAETQLSPTVHRMYSRLQFLSTSDDTSSLRSLGACIANNISTSLDSHKMCIS